MRDEIITMLQNLNRDFYNQFAESFARSRAPSEPGLENIIDCIDAGDRVLDLGCGQGRLALLLPEGVNYTGMDYSTEMLVVARKAVSDRELDANFVLGNLMDDDWPAQVTRTPYDCIFLRAVLHHIPSYAHRIRLLKHAADTLSAGGLLVIANWQFLNIPRLKKRLIPWDQLKIAPEDVEPGDYLLDWQRDGYGIRYVHLVDDAETRQLARDAGLHVLQIYYADGHTNNLTLYAILTNAITRL